MDTGITVDTINKQIVVQWADRDGDIVPAPTDAFPRFTSSDIGVLRLAPVPTNPWAQQILPVAPGVATVTIAVIDGLGQPYRNPDGDAITLDPVNVKVGPGLPETATLEVTDDEPTGGTPAPQPVSTVASIDPNAPGADAALAASGPAPTPPPAQTGGGPVGPTPAPATVPPPPGGGGTTPANLTLGSIELAAGTIGEDYAANVGNQNAVSNESGTVEWSFEGLPPGLHGDPDGSVTGQPTSTGTFTVTITARDSDGHTATAQTTLTVAAVNATGAGPSPASGTGNDQPAGSGAAPADTAGATAVARDAAGKPLYTYAGEGTPDATAWPTAPVVASDGRALYTFSGDTANGDPTGTSDVWTPYTGPTQPAPAA